MQELRILIADDHRIVIDGIKMLLSDTSGLKVVGEAINGKEAIKILEEDKIDIAILDIDMTPVNGIEVSEYIQKHGLATKVIVLSMHSKKEYIYQLMEADIDGYILKGKGIDELLEAIRTINEGKKYYGREVMNTIFQDQQKKKQKNNSKKIILSKREQEVVRLIARGHTTQEISEKLFISYYTVETHRKNILAKLQLKNSTQLVRYALDNGLE
ncbi:response regulator transcription factor [Chondrinema litorale]|uniref:response regulator transcription factor n=1 Tax=Chondrinema litorale TaxID=2994555 RepID=UPI002543E0AE|nr:response regulator transcription factor [Chondrinema litorale]UZR99688.1 response regulator transcription factor [Chondrinema litorale]